VNEYGLNRLLADMKNGQGEDPHYARELLMAFAMKVLRNRVLSRCGKTVLDRSDLESAYLQVVAEKLRSAQTLESPEAMVRWLARALTRTAIDLGRKKVGRDKDKRRVFVDFDESHGGEAPGLGGASASFVAAGRDAPESQVAEAQEATMLHAAMCEVFSKGPPKDRQMVALRLASLDGLSSDEVSRHEEYCRFFDGGAGTVAPSAALVRKDVERAKEALREHLILKGLCRTDREVQP